MLNLQRTKASSKADNNVLRIFKKYLIIFKLVFLVLCDM